MSIFKSRQAKEAKESLSRRDLALTRSIDGEVEPGFIVELNASAPRLLGSVTRAVERAQDAYLKRHDIHSNDSQDAGFFIAVVETTLRFSRIYAGQKGNKWALQTRWPWMEDLNKKEERERALFRAEQLEEYRGLLKKELAAVGALHLLRQAKPQSERGG